MKEFTWKIFFSVVFILVIAVFFFLTRSSETEDCMLSCGRSLKDVEFFDEGVRSFALGVIEKFDRKGE